MAVCVAKPGHHGHRPHRRYLRSATPSGKEFTAIWWTEVERGVSKLFLGSQGGLSSRGRRQRRGGAAVPSSSGILRRVPSYELMAGGPPRGVAGKRGSACSAGLSFEAAHWPMQVCALHCIALRDARALLPCVYQLTHIICRCTVPQVATMVDRQDRPGRGWRAEFGAL